MKLVVAYLRQHFKSFFFYLLFSLLFFIVFYFYSYPLNGVCYAFVICSFIGMIAILIDYMNFYKKHQQLENLQKQITLTIDHLPETSLQLEKDYQRLIELIHDDKMKMLSDHDYRYQEMIDYYTLWAHQIKTPIAAMRLLLQSDAEIAECEEELFKIEQYVEMVLSFLRVEEAESDFILKQNDCDEMLKQAIRKYAKLFIRKKIALNYQPINQKILTDEKWFVFMIEQILSNAIKYTSTGSITITCENKVLKIQDSGIGIQKEDLPRVFEKGFTGYNGHKDKKSTGIGLYLVKKICDRLGHTIKIESEINVGTTIIIDCNSIELEIE